jgi:L-arabinose isomerase
LFDINSSPPLGKPSLEIQPLSIGGKSDSPRLVFAVKNGPAITAWPLIKVEVGSQTLERPAILVIE